MTFESFTNTLVVAAIRHEWMQDELAAAGVRLEDLPEKSLSRATWISYLDKKKSSGHDVAAFDLTRDLDLLEKFSEPLTAIPKSPEVLRDKFQQLFDEYQFQILADDLRLNPAKGKEIIGDFHLKEARAVKSQTLAELSILVGEQYALAKEKKSVKQVQGFERLSEMIGGFNPERLGIFLGGTGFGKTNFAINLALAGARSMSVGYVNMEMGYADMVKRFAVIGAKVSYLDYATGNFDKGQVEGALRKVGDNIDLTSGRALSFDQISAWARLLAKKKQVELLIIDYDQKVDLKLRYQLEEWKALQKVMEALEDLSKELQLYVLVLAQVNREGLISGSHRAQFPAHTVLAFYDHEEHGPIIEAKKNRHGKKNQALSVAYDERNSSITEQSVFTIEQKTKKQERHELKPKAPGQAWWRGE